MLFYMCKKIMLHPFSARKYFINFIVANAERFYLALGLPQAANMITKGLNCISFAHRGVVSAE